MCLFHELLKFYMKIVYNFLYEKHIYFSRYRKMWGKSPKVLDMNEMIDELPEGYAEKIEHLVNTLSKMSVDLADKGCLAYELAEQVSELLTDALIALTSKTWKGTQLTRNNIVKSANIIMDAWEKCNKNNKSI